MSVGPARECRHKAADRAPTSIVVSLAAPRRFRGSALCAASQAAETFTWPHEGRTPEAGGTAPRSAVPGSVSAPRPSSRKWSWTRRMAIEPSPTAAATRLTDPCRTSPTAKTPGRLDSRNIGSRRSGHCSSACPPWRRSVPVTTKPDWSRRTASGSHWVRGSAPINTNRAIAFTVSAVPDSRSVRVRLSRRLWPVPPATTGDTDQLERTSLPMPLTTPGSWWLGRSCR